MTRRVGWLVLYDGVPQRRGSVVGLLFSVTTHGTGAFRDARMQPRSARASLFDSPGEARTAVTADLHMRDDPTTAAERRELEKYRMLPVHEAPKRPRRLSWPW